MDAQYVEKGMSHTAEEIDKAVDQSVANANEIHGLKEYAFQIIQNDLNNLKQNKADTEAVEELKQEINELNQDAENKYTKAEVDEKLNDKVEKIEGKGLSTNDFSDEYKNKINKNAEDLENTYTKKETIDIFSNEFDKRKGKSVKSVKPSLFIGGMTLEDAKSQIDYLISDGFKEFILPLTLKYNDSLELTPLIVSGLDNIISYIENKGCTIYCLKFHMLVDEFNKKDTSVEEYCELVKSVLDEYSTHFNMCVVFNEVPNILENYSETVINLLNHIKTYGILASVSFSHYGFVDYVNSTIINHCDNVCVNWYPAVSWNKYPELPTAQMYETAFEQRGWVQKALKYGKPIIISEIGITPFYEALHSPGTTGRGITVHENNSIPAIYMSNLLKSSVTSNVEQIWTWFNEYQTSELDDVWRSYNKQTL